MTTQWNLNTFSAFYESQKSNPYEYNRLLLQDPAGKMWAALTKAEQDYREALAEHRALGDGIFSIDPARTAELEVVMAAGLATRTAMIAGLESACAALGDAAEPTVRYLQYQADYKKRVRRGDEAAVFEALIVTLEGIADSCFE